MNIDRDLWKRFTGKQFIINQNIALFFGQTLLNTFPKRISLDSG